MKNAYYLFLLFVFCGCSLQDVDPEEINTGYAYFPLEKGAVWIYDVYKIKYRLTENDTSNHFLKVEITDTFSIGKEITYVAERKVANTIDGPWSLDSVWSFKRNPTQAIVTENSIRYLHLVFPLKNGITYNRNALNNKPPEQYTIEDLRRPYQIPEGNYYNETVIASMERQDNVVNTRDKFVVYAKNIGLIHRYELSIEQQPGEPPFGYLLDKKLVRYGP